MSNRGLFEVVDDEDIARHYETSLKFPECDSDKYIR